MNDYRVLAKKERFRLTQNEHKDIEDDIKLLDNKFILGDITFTVYKQKYIELVKDMPTSNKLKQAINGHFSCVLEYGNVSQYFYSLQKKS